MSINELFMNILFFSSLIFLGGIFIYWSMRGDPPVEKALQMPPLQLQPPVLPSYIKPCIFSIKDAELREEAKRDVGNAMLVLLRSSDIGLEPGFRDYMYCWLQRSIDTTRAALVSLSLLKDGGFIKHNQDRILNFVNRCFDEKQGGYSIVPFPTPNGKEEKVSIYGTSNAIEVIKHALGIPIKEKLINNGNTNEFLKKIIEWRDTKLNEFIRSCVELKDNIHYVYDQPGNNTTDGICVTYLLSRLFWSLNRENKLFELIPKSEIENYIENCEKSIDVDGSALGFAPSPSQKKPTMSATSFALSLMGDKPYYKEEFTKLRNKFFNDEKKTKFLKFIDRCWDEQRGGYGASEGRIASTNGTYFALRIMNLLGLKIEKDKIERIKQFVRECYCDGGGFTFSKDFSPKMPFAHGTRWVLQIDKELSEKNEGSLTKVLSKENGGILIKEPSKKDGGILTNEQREETKDFLIYELYNREEGGFLGLPIPPDVRAKNCPLINKDILPLSRGGFAV
ncbi:MAG TPA: prenyltransferase/squalene oxidase repeat-containing protein [Candidatus Brocadiia bacterium]|nr:hypothetical protein [Candidatus Brocadiales bacterium]